ncbi:MAG: holin, BlyA family protein [Clostridiales bacterium]|nr:holin, BlyA family protein [Clostridiales bacterium]
MRKIINKLANYQVDGVGVVEIILILVILIGLVLIFKDQITDIVNDAFDAITQDATDIIS